MARSTPLPAAALVRACLAAAWHARGCGKNNLPFVALPCVRVCMHVHAHARVRVGVCVHVHVHARVHECMRMCMSVCVCVCIWCACLVCVGA